MYIDLFINKFFLDVGLRSLYDLYFYYSSVIFVQAKLLSVNMIVGDLYFGTFIIKEN